MDNVAKPAIWFFCGSQHLYGASALEQVASNAQTIASSIDASKQLPLEFVFKGFDERFHVGELEVLDVVDNFVLGERHGENSDSVELRNKRDGGNPPEKR